MVNAIYIGNSFRAEKLHGWKFYAERIIFVGKLEMISIHYCSSNNVFTSWFHPFLYHFIMDIKVCDPNLRFFTWVGYFCWIKIGDTVCSSKNKFALMVCKASSFAEFIALQSVTCIEINETLVFGVEPTDSIIRTDPEISIHIFLDCTYIIARQTIFYCIFANIKTFGIEVF